MAVQLVKQRDFQIISVDSAQVYSGMDIGTGKPDAQTLEIAPHRLIDILDPSQVYSASDFRRDALAEIAGRTSSASAVATNSSSLSTDTLVYQASFISGEWSGSLKAFPFLPTGFVSIISTWESQAIFDTQNYDNHLIE